MHTVEADARRHAAAHLRRRGMLPARAPVLLARDGGTLVLALLVGARAPAPLPPPTAVRLDAIGVLLDGDGALLRLHHLEGASPYSASCW